MSSTAKLRKKTLDVDLYQELEKDRIKEQVDIIALFSLLGVSLVKKGTSYQGSCPFHQGKDATLSVIPKGRESVYNCFECGASGDIFTAVETLKNLDYQEAKAFLESNLDRITLSGPSLDSAQEPSFDSARDAEQEERATGKSTIRLPGVVEVAMDDLVKHWQGKLVKSKKAMNYLKGQGISDKAILTRFSLGYSDGSLPDKLGAGQKLFLQEQGILTGTGEETFKDSLIIPLCDDQGKAVNLVIFPITGERSRSSRSLHEGKEGIFNRKASKVYPDKLILTGSVLEALAFCQLGFENVQAVTGATGLTEEHKELLQNDRVKAVVLALPEADELKAYFLTRGTAVQLITPPAGESWNDAVTKELSGETVEKLISGSPLFLPKEKEYFQAEKKHGAYIFTLPPLTYTLTGVNEGFVNSLKVNVKAVVGDETHYDTLNLYSARSRSGYSLQLCRLAEAEPRRIEKDLIKILEYLEEQRDKKFTEQDESPPELTQEQREAGMELLQTPDILDQVAADLTALGYVGEDLNKKLVYLCATSRKMDDPISVLLVSQSASGKSYLIDSVKKLIPPEETESITTLSDQALNYMDNLVHKFVVFGEAVHSEIIEHQLREMLSSKELSRYVVQKDPKTGELTTRKMSKPVVVSSVMSTTNHRINPENASRYFIINTDETREQTRRIYQAHRNKYSREREERKKKLIPRLIEQHRSAQRLLQKRMIVIPEALREAIDFPDSLMRLRRDHERFIDLIASVCFLRQFQKEIKQGKDFQYIECDGEDYKAAYDIMLQGVLSSTMGELPIQAITLYDVIREMIHEDAQVQNLSPTEITFTQRDIREYGSLNQMFVKRYLRILTDFEYILSSGNGIRGSRKSYRLCRDEPLDALNTSMIPTPDQMEQFLKPGLVES